MANRSPAEAVQRLTEAFNEWMRRYTEEPERFSREWEAVRDFLREQSDGSLPSYGRECAEYLRSILRDLSDQDWILMPSTEEPGDAATAPPSTDQ